MICIYKKTIFPFEEQGAPLSVSRKVPVGIRRVSVDLRRSRRSEESLCKLLVRGGQGRRKCVQVGGGGGRGRPGFHGMQLRITHRVDTCYQGRRHVLMSTAYTQGRIQPLRL